MQLNARLQIVLGAALLSTGGAAIKACTLSGWQVASFRSAVAAVVLLALLPATRRGWTLRTMAVGLAYAATLILYVLANKRTTAANAIFLQATAPIYIFVLGPWLLQERLHRRDAWFVILMLSGMVLFFLQVEPPQPSAPNPLLGNLLALSSGLCYALTILGLRWIARDRGARDGEPMKAVAAGNVLACLLCAPWVFPLLPGPPTDWLYVAYLGVFQIGLAYVLITAGMRRVTAVEAALLILIEPVLNPVWAWLFQGERPGAFALAGGAIILGASLLKALIRAKEA